jgi:CBS domain-containing protein
VVTTTVRQVLSAKGGDAWSVAPETPIIEALQLMAEKDVGAVLVRHGERLVGIFSERDYARKVVLRGRSSRDTAVSEVMTSRVVCVRPDATSEECLALMTDKRVRHLPVQENERILGVISIGDVVKAILADQRFVIGQLESYIAGGR